ncbi:MAG: ribonuclease III [Ignavibacteriae bacterium]|nr:MAG: ribonuclease III [Ignavibacteriota bacterium]
MLEKIFSFFHKKRKLLYPDIDTHKKEAIYKFIYSLLGKYPNDEKYFIKAFAHRSYLEQSVTLQKSNERLEFLGDSVLGKIVAEYLFLNYPDKDEGFLTKSRSLLVNKDSLKKIGFSLELQKYLFLNNNFISSNKKKTGKIVADCLEALIGAIYLDFGEKIASNFVTKFIILPQIKEDVIYFDNNYKGQLLEFAHANKLESPIYKIIEEIGPEHEKIFTIAVYISEKQRGLGTGKNKKKAEQNAAKKALEKLKHKMKNVKEV